MTNYRQYSSIQTPDGYELFVNTGNGDCWLEKDGVLVKTDNVDWSTDPQILALYKDFESP